MTCLLAFLQHVEHGNVFVDVVDAVGVVPEDAEVLCCGLHGCQGFNSFVRIAAAQGIRVLGHAPDAFHGLVLYEFADLIHVRTPLRERHRDHLDAQGLADRKMSVITGNGAEEFDLIVPAPGLFGSENAQQHGSRHAVEHEGEGGRSYDDGLFGSDAHQFAEQLSRFLQPQQLTVVAGVGAVLIVAVAGGIEHVQHGHGQRQLIGAGLASCHVQVQVKILIFLIFFQQQFFLLLQFFAGAFGIIFHKTVLLSAKMPNNLFYPVEQAFSR